MEGMQPLKVRWHRVDSVIWMQQHMWRLQCEILQEQEGVSINSLQTSAQTSKQCYDAKETSVPPGSCWVSWNYCYHSARAPGVEGERRGPQSLLWDRSSTLRWSWAGALEAFWAQFILWQSEPLKLGQGIQEPGRKWLQAIGIKAEVFQGAIAQEIPVLYNLNLVLPKVKYTKLEAVEISGNRTSLIPAQER